MTDKKQDPHAELMRLADAYRTSNYAECDSAKTTLSAHARTLTDRIAELEAQLEAVGAGGVGAMVPANRFDATEMILRDVCEMEPADHEANDTIRIDISDLKRIVEHHIGQGSRAEPSSTATMTDALTSIATGVFGGAKCAEIASKALRQTLAQPAPAVVEPSALVNTLLLETEKFWWNDGPEGKTADDMNVAKDAVLRALAAPHPHQIAEPASQTLDADLWYLQDTRSFIGNDVVWWAKDGKGYTTDVSKAHVYNREDAFRQAAVRGVDRPWPKAYIDLKTRPAVDMQYIDHAIATKEPS